MGHRVVIADHKGPDIVAKAAVPFGPAGIGGKRTDLVQAGRIPGLGDHLGVAENRIFADNLDHRRIGQDVALAVAAENGGKVKAKTVDMHLGHPVTQGFYYQFTNHRMIAVHGVAAAGEI